MKVKLHLHPSQFREKPDSDKIKRLNYSILDEITEIELEELAERVGNCGQTFLPAIMNGKRGKNNFIEQQIFALDFDGGFTLEEFWQRAEQFDVKPVFIYETFSSTKELQKFRVVYVNDCAIDNGEVAELMVAMLMKIFPESD